MGQALYRKHRSKKFSEVIGQKHITDTLEKAIKSRRISHAYLFSGPKGVGKTSVARILAHEINGLEYKDESVHLDIIEIDAASNRRIDEIRDLREKVHLAPTSAKYKVYIIDEVHMLTGEAFNALLKTLEEPPAHCIFILATTEPHKLPETIVSRTQHFSFKAIESKPAATHLQAIAKEEKIDIEPAALELLAEHGEGSFRDSISLLDQLSSASGKITEDTVREFIGLPPAQSITKLIISVSGGDSGGVIAELELLKSLGSNAAAICRQLSADLRSQIITDSNAASWKIKLLKDLLEIPASRQPFDSLEIALLTAAASNSGVAAPGPVIYSAKPSNAIAPPDPAPPETEPVKIVKKAPSKGGFNLEMWPEVVKAVKAKAASIYTALRLAKPSLEDDKLVLAFKFGLHKNKLSRAENLRVIEDTIEEFSGQRLKVECIVDNTDAEPKTSKNPEPVPQIKANHDVTAISNIFGSAEVLES